MKNRFPLNQTLPAQQPCACRLCAVGAVSRISASSGIAPPPAATMPADRSYALPDQARRADMAMDRLGVERVIVAGRDRRPASPVREFLVQPPVLPAGIAHRTEPS
jgi:hypothetical protein